MEKESIDINNISSRLKKLSCKNDYPIISLDRICYPTASFYLEVTRLTNPSTGQVKIGPRPGFDSLENQVKKIAGKTINLVDVGAFDGGTLLEICGLLENKGIEISEIYLGVSSEEANRRINNKRSMTAAYLFNFGEWIELRDFFGIDGRNIGTKKGIRQFIPYWQNLSWASIPKNNWEKAKELCKEYNAKLLGILIKTGYTDKQIKEKIGETMSLR